MESIRFRHQSGEPYKIKQIEPFDGHLGQFALLDHVGEVHGQALVAEGADQIVPVHHRHVEDGVHQAHDDPGPQEPHQQFAQFMVGNGILAFAVIFVVVIFIYMSMRLQQKQQEERHFIETYTISLVKGFTSDSISLFVNDSLISNKTIIEEPYTVEVGRFAEQSALLIVDNKTELVSTFDLSERGGNYQFEKEEDGIKQLAK